MLDKKLFDILAHDGIVAIATCCDNVPHVVNTWHNYVNVTEDGRLLIPAGGMAETERNIEMCIRDRFRTARFSQRRDRTGFTPVSLLSALAAAAQADPTLLNFCKHRPK